MVNRSASGPVASGERIASLRITSFAVPVIVIRPASGPVADRFGGQATKGIRWMPWRQEVKKDVASCDKPRGAANERRSVDLRMGKPLPRKSVEPGAEDR